MAKKVEVHAGKVKNIRLPVTVSTAFAERSLVEMTSGKVGVADDNDILLKGIIVGAIVAADTDFADVRKVEIQVPMEANVEYRFTEQTGFTAAADIGLEFGISDAVTLDQSDTTNVVAKVISVNGPSTSQTIVCNLKIDGNY